jgi:hypothetical protein
MISLGCFIAAAVLFILRGLDVGGMGLVWIAVALCVLGVALGGFKLPPWNRPPS